MYDRDGSGENYSRECWITREKHEECVGGNGTSSNMSPQERWLLIIESDTQLQKMIDQK